MAAPLEIERKFLVRDASWKAVAGDPVTIRQAYLAREGKTAVRIRQKGERHVLTVKSEKDARTRVELEWEVSAEEARVLFDDVVSTPPIEKTRWHVANGDTTFEVDEFHGVNEGLVVAEVELRAADQIFALPTWLGPEVTEDRRFLNTSIAERPFETWGVDYAALLASLEERP